MTYTYKNEAEYLRAGKRPAVHQRLVRYTPLSGSQAGPPLAPDFIARIPAPWPLATLIPTFHLHMVIRTPWGSSALRATQLVELSHIDPHLLSFPAVRLRGALLIAAS